jgi:hypothetical protein
LNHERHIAEKPKQIDERRHKQLRPKPQKVLDRESKRYMR